MSEKEKKILTYNKALKELETIVSKIESENVDVDSLADMIKRAVELISFLKEKLFATQNEIEKALKDLEEILHKEK
ncbi:MAG: exodeoxyribonuclease VII small subunit [Bacteroidales bacterium]|nr:exodeoxyribonuclease VII small subunit [Bacteroidales bacterium]